MEPKARSAEQNLKTFQDISAPDSDLAKGKDEK